MLSYVCFHMGEFRGRFCAAYRGETYSEENIAPEARFFSEVLAVYTGRLVYTQQYAVYGDSEGEALCIEQAFTHSIHSTFEIGPPTKQNWKNQNGEPSAYQC